MSFSSIASMLSAAQESGQPLYAVIRDADCQENGYDAAASYRQIAALWTAMQQSSRQYCASDRSNSGLIGGGGRPPPRRDVFSARDGRGAQGGRVQCVHEAHRRRAHGGQLRRAAGGADPACGGARCCGGDDPAGAVYRGRVRPGHGAARERGRRGGRLPGGDRHGQRHGGGCADAHPRWQCADAYAIALGNLLGLVCDPVAGLVEVPCVKRNVIGAVNAVSAANMAVAGITSRIPVDEVIDAMGEVGDALPASLRETGLGGLAATPTGRQAAARIARAEP